MPGTVRTPADEKKWSEAKAAVHKQYPNIKESSDRFWALTQSIYLRMKGDKKAMADDGKGGYLVTEENGDKHLPTTKNGTPDHGLMGGAWAALHGGYRGQKYDGPNKQEAISKLKALYKREGMETPDKQAASARFTDYVRRLFHGPDASIAACAVAIYATDQGGTPEWVELIPAGKFTSVDGRGPFSNTDPEKIVSASMQRMPEVGIVLDYDHSTDLAAPEGRPAIAAGWIKQFKVVSGAIFARVEWTKQAAEALTDKLYRYISPVFEHDKKGNVEIILRAALTNNPALTQLPAIASAQLTNPYEDTREAAAGGTDAAGMPGADDKEDMPKEEMSLTERTKRMEAALPRNEGESLTAHHKRIMKHLQMEMEMDEDAGAGTEDAGALKDWAEQEEKEDDHSPSGPGGPMAPDGKPDEDEAHMMKRHEDEMSTMAKRHEAELAGCRDDMARKETTARHGKEQEDMARRHETETARGKETAGKKETAGSYGRDMGGKEIVGRPSGSTSMNSALVRLRNEQTALRREQTELKESWARDTAVRRVDEAIHSGRLLPAQRDRAIKFCVQHPVDFVEFLATQPRIIEKGEDGTFRGRLGEAPQGEMNSRESEICVNLGLPDIFGSKYKELFIGARTERLNARPKPEDL